MLTADSLETLPGIRHGFFSRQGGVSEGAYSSLNCGFGSGDERDRVTANRACAMQRLGAPVERLATAYQVHSDRAAVVEAPWPLDDRPQVDALVTRTPGLALGVLTADCVPLLLVDQEARVVAAVHAGWRGLAAGIAPTGKPVLSKVRSAPIVSRHHLAWGSVRGSCQLMNG